MSDKKARKETVKKSPFCKDTVYKVLKEKHMYGYFLDGPLPRTRLSIYDKLSVEKKEQIRFTVSFEATDLGSLFGNAQCENFKIFLKLRFYLKSILVIWNPQKLPF